MRHGPLRLGRLGGAVSRVDHQHAASHWPPAGHRPDHGVGYTAGAAVARVEWSRGEWLPRGAKKPRREYRYGAWLVSEGHNHEQAKAGKPWALVGPGHESYHARASEARNHLAQIQKED